MSSAATPPLTGQPQPGQPAAQAQDPQARISQLLANIAKMVQANKSRQVQPLTQASSPAVNFNAQGAASPQISSGAPPPSFIPTPQPSNQGTRDFRSPQSRNTAGFADLGSTLSSMVNSVRQKQQQEVFQKASSLANTVGQLLGSGDPQDRKTAELLLEDKKNLKILEKGIGYFQTFEETPPEAHGVQAGLQQAQKKLAIGSQGFQQGMKPVFAQPNPAQQIQRAQQMAMLQRLKQDPNLALPTQLSSKQMGQEERIKGGLEVSPQEKYELSAAEQKEVITQAGKAMDDYYKAQSDYAKTQLENQGKTTVATIGAQSRVEAARILAWSRIQAAKQRQAKEKIPPVSVQTKWEAMQRAKTAMDTIMSGKGTAQTKTELLGNLKNAGLTSIAGLVPGIMGWVPGAGTEKWKGAQGALNKYIDSYGGAIKKAYPDFGKGVRPDEQATPSQTPSDDMDQELDNIFGKGQ